MKRPSLEAEADLVEACRQGDKSALEAVFRAHAPYLERLLTRIVGPTADVDDLLQTTFVAAIRAFPRFRGEAQVRTWLSRIAVRTAQEHLRRPERRRFSPMELVTDNVQDHRVVDSERQAAGKERLERMHRHLEAIGAKKRVAFVLHVFEGHPIDEVAALMGASAAATKSRVFWARKELFSRVRKDPGLKDLVAAEHSS